MSKLLRLHTWLTTAEAARHLSEALSETVTEASVLRLALDGRLKLSVNLVNGALATETCDIIVPVLRDLRAVDTDVVESAPEGIPAGVASDLVDQALMSARNRNLEVMTIDGVWDLPMIDADRLEVEKAYQAQTGGPEVTRPCLNGTFVQRLDGKIFQLVDRQLDAKWPFSPVGGLPNGSIFVVRAEALAQFYERVSNDPALNGEQPHLPTTIVRVNAAAAESANQSLRSLEQPALNSKEVDIVGGSKLAAWLRAEMDKRHMTVHRLHALSDLDRKTIKRILAGELVRKVRLGKLASGLSMDVSSIPID